MTTDKFEKMCVNRRSFQWCEMVLNALGEDECDFNFTFDPPHEKLIGSLRATQCPQWLREIIYRAVETHMDSLDEEFKEL